MTTPTRKFKQDQNVLFNGRLAYVRVVDKANTTLPYFINEVESGLGRWVTEGELVEVTPTFEPKPEPVLTQPEPVPVPPSVDQVAKALRIIIADEVRKIVREVVEQRLDELEPVTKAELNELVDERINDELDGEFESKFDDRFDESIETWKDDNLSDEIRDCLRHRLTLNVEVD